MAPGLPGGVTGGLPASGCGVRRGARCVFATRRNESDRQREPRVKTRVSPRRLLSERTNVPRPLAQQLVGPVAGPILPHKGKKAGVVRWARHKCDTRSYFAPRRRDRGARPGGSVLRGTSVDKPNLAARRPPPAASRCGSRLRLARASPEAISASAIDVRKPLLRSSLADHSSARCPSA